MENIQDVMSPDGGVCEGEEPGGQVPGDGGEGHVGKSRHSSAGRLIRYLD